MTTPTWSDILYEEDPPIARIIWNRPETKNTIRRPETEAQYAEALKVAAADDGIKVIIVKGAGPCWSVGHALMKGQPEFIHRFDYPFWKQIEGLASDGEVIRAAWDCPKPVIAQVHGYCLGAASSIALTCDFVICSEDALFGHPAMRYFGAGPDDGGLWVWNCGPQWAKRQLFSGMAVDAQTALRIGWTTEVVPNDKLQETVEALARKIANVPMNVLYLNKKFANRTIELAGYRVGCATSAEYLTFSFMDEEVRRFYQMCQEQGVRAAFAMVDEKFGGRGGIERKPSSDE